MNRRERISKGYVNFPMHDPQYKNTCEGGMVVKLVVINNADFSDPLNFEVCLGSVVTDMLHESFLGSDSISFPNYEDYSDYNDYAEMRDKCYEQYFPNINADTSIMQYAMRPALCSMVIGNTGWSGWNTIDDEYWKCSYDDLTDEGKELYNSLQKLYGPNASIHLLTFLDT